MRRASGGRKSGWDQTPEERVLSDAPQEDVKLACRCQGLTCETKNQKDADWTRYQSSLMQKVEVGAQGISVPHGGHTTMVLSVRLDPSDRNKHDATKEKGFRVRRLTLRWDVSRRVA